MEQKKILVVDDEQDLREILLYNLTAFGYEAQEACSAEEALSMMANAQATGIKSPDLLLLDVMMPGMSGFELASKLKHDEQTARIPIIFLTAKDTEQDMLHGFGLGADDYVRKPFSVREVMARVKAVLERSALSVASRQELLRHKGLTVDMLRKTVVADDEAIALTRTEFDLLSVLLKHCGQVLSRQELLEWVWPKNVIVTHRTVDVNIARMRKKIGRYGQCIIARQGFGYVFEVKGEEPATAV